MADPVTFEVGWAIEMVDVIASDGYEAVTELELVSVGVIVLDGRRAVARVLEETRQVCLTSLPMKFELL